MSNLPKNDKEALSIAENESTPAVHLHELAKLTPAPHPRVVSALLAHENVAPETLDLIHERHQKGEVRLDNNALYSMFHNKKLLPSTVNRHLDSFTADTYNRYGKGHEEALKHPAADSKKVAEKVKAIFDKNPESYHEQGVMERFLQGPHATPAHIDEYIKHPEISLAKAALKSPHATDAHVKQYIKHPKFDANYAEELINEDHADDKPRLSAKMIRELYEKHGISLPEDTYRRGDMDKAVASHPNTPDDIIEDFIEKGRDSDYNHWDSRGPYSLAKRALIGPKAKKERVEALAREGHRAAVGAALKREDSSPEFLRHLYGNKEYREAHGSEFARHPNLPKELQMEYAKGSSEEARHLLDRQHIDEDVLKQLVHHKNQKVAVHALGHDSVTADVVQHAYKRKAGDVSRAAAAHPLADQSLKIEKALKDPKAAASIAIESEDPEILKKIHEAHGKDLGVMHALVRNPETPPEILHGTTQNLHDMHDQAPEPRGYDYDTERKMRDISEELGKNPNLNRDARLALLKHKSTYGYGIRHEDLTGEDMREALEHWHNSTETYAGGVKKQMVHHFLRHDNLTEDVAKDLVSGKYGPSEDAIHGNSLDVNARPDVFTKDVVKAGLATAPELTAPSTVSALARSQHLAPDEIETHLNRTPPREQDSIEATSHHTELINGLLQNPNTKPETLANILNRKRKAYGESWQGDRFNRESPHELVLENPSLREEDLKAHYQDADHDSHRSGSEYKALKKVIEDRGLMDHALTNASSDVVRHLVNGASYGEAQPDPERFEKAMDHSNPEVVDRVIEDYGRKMSHNLMSAHRYEGEEGNEIRKRVFDRFLDPKYPSFLARSAYPHMTADGKQQYVQSADMSDPGVISGMTKEQIESYKLPQEAPAAAVEALLSHTHAAPQHFLDAVAHSEDRALSALKNFKTAFPINREEFYRHALNEHPESARIGSHIAARAQSDETLDALVNHSRAGHFVGALLDNKNVLGGHIEQLLEKGHIGEGHAEDLVGHKKSTVKILSKLMEMHPDLARNVAKHPKAGSGKLLKQILATGDADAKAALVRNERVPEDVRTELLKDPHVLLRAPARMVTPEALDHYATSDDPQILLKLSDHDKLTTEVADKLLKHVVEQGHHTADHGYGQELLHNLAMGDKLSDAGKARLADATETAAFDLVRYSGSLPEPVQKQILDKYDGEEIAARMLAREDVQNKDVMMRSATRVRDFETHEDDITSFMRRPEPDHDVMNKLFDNYVAGGKFNRNMRFIDAAANKGGEHIQNHFLKQDPGLSMILELAHNQHLTPENHGKVLQGVIERDIARASGDIDTHFTKALTGLAGTPSASPENLNKIVDHLLDESRDRDASHTKKALRAAANNANADTAVVDKVFKSDWADADTLTNPKVSEATYREKLFNLFGGSGNADRLQELAQNPRFSLKMIREQYPDLDFKKPNQTKHLDALYSGLTGNMRARSEDLAAVYHDYTTPDRMGHYFGGGEKKNLIKNPQTPESVVKDMIEKGHVSQEDAYYAPSIGGKLWREKKHEFPKVPGVQKGKENTVARLRPREEKIHAVRDMIPEGGHLEWAQFKKENPSLAGDPLVQKLFTSAPKTRVTKEIAEEYLNKMPSKDFHVSYTHWNGMQRHNESNTQLVVQINNGPEQDKMMKDPNLNGLYAMVRNASQYSGHPINPQCIGWSRVDASHPEHWFIDEIQSDFNSSLSRSLHEFQNQTAGESKMREYGVESNEAGQKAVSKIVDNIQGWEHAILNNIIETARAHGVKKVTIHSGQTKTHVNKGGKAEVTNKYDKLYNKLPEKLGFERDYYQNVPTHDPKSALVGQPVWTLHLDKQSVKKSEYWAELLVKTEELVRRRRQQTRKVKGK
jgi:hypothetical protein